MNYLDIVTNCLDKIKHYCADFVHYMICVNNLALIRVCFVPYRCAEILSHFAAVGGKSASFTNFSFYPLWFKESVARGAAALVQRSVLLRATQLSASSAVSPALVLHTSKACSTVGTSHALIPLK